MRSKPTERDLEIHTARVLLAGARTRRQKSPRFADTLLQWAANARRRAMAAGKPKAVQADLFAGDHPRFQSMAGE